MEVRMVSFNKLEKGPVTQFGHSTIQLLGIDLSGEDCVQLLKQRAYFRDSLIYGSDGGVEALIRSQAYVRHATDPSKTYRLVFVPTESISEDRFAKKMRTTKRLREYIDGLYPGSLIATAMSASLAISLRLALGDQDLKKDLKMEWVAILHEPIVDCRNIPMMLRVSSGFDGRRLVYSHARDDDEFDPGGGVAVVLSSS